MSLKTKLNNFSKALFDSRYRYMYWQRSIENRKQRNLQAATIARKLPSYTVKNTLAATQFEQDGIFHLAKPLPLETVNSIKAYLSTCQSYDPYRQDLGFFHAPDQVPPHTHVAHFRAEDFVKAPHVLEIANSPEVLDIVGAYFGCKPTISLMTAWWSVPSHEGAQEAENFHRDYDDLKFAKLFVYLTDVDEESGPHFFVKGSHNSDSLIWRKRYQDKEVLESFPEKSDHLTLTGKAGTAFIETTFGLHRGVPPLSKPRLLLQILYSLNPIFTGPKKPLLEIDQKSNPALDSYVNRVYCKLR
jgi:Phytanoyl-CoA dioxygenase (PhyH)